MTTVLPALPLQLGTAASAKISGWRFWPLRASTPVEPNAPGAVMVVFTATASLLNSFSRLRLQPHVLAPADPARLPDRGRHWGRYYDTQPKVMFGDIHYGYTQLA